VSRILAYAYPWLVGLSAIAGWGEVTGWLYNGHGQIGVDGAIVLILVTFFVLLVGGPERERRQREAIIREEKPWGSLRPKDGRQP
jgi:hypothetical protein